MAVPTILPIPNGSPCPPGFSIPGRYPTGWTSWQKQNPGAYPCWNMAPGTVASAAVWAGKLPLAPVPAGALQTAALQQTGLLYSPAAPAAAPDFWSGTILGYPTWIVLGVAAVGAYFLFFSGGSKRR